MATDYNWKDPRNFNEPRKKKAKRTAPSAVRRRLNQRAKRRLTTSFSSEEMKTIQGIIFDHPASNHQVNLPGWEDVEEQVASAQSSPQEKEAGQSSSERTDFEDRDIYNAFGRAPFALLITSVGAMTMVLMAAIELVLEGL